MKIISDKYMKKHVINYEQEMLYILIYRTPTVAPISPTDVAFDIWGSFY